MTENNWAIGGHLGLIFYYINGGFSDVRSGRNSNLSHSEITCFSCSLKEANTDQITKMWQAKQRAKQFFANRPKTSIFLGTTLFFGSLPITVFASIVLCVSLVLGTAFILLQGTVLAVTFAALATTLAGPICIASIVTIVFYAVRRSYLALRCLRVQMLTTTTTFLEQFHVLPEDETNTRNKDPQHYPVKDPSSERPKSKYYQCQFCRANRHDLCVSRKLAHNKKVKNASQQTSQPPT